MKYGFSNKQYSEILNILAGYPEIEKAVLFGSRAIGTWKEASDVDIAIYGEKTDIFVAGRLKDHFEEETFLPFFFDIIAFNSIRSEELKEHIRDKGVEIYCKGVNEWKEYKLVDVCDIYDGPHATPPKEKEGLVFLGISSLGFDGRINPTHFEFVNEEFFKKWTKRVEPQFEDIVFSYETKLGVAAMIPKQFVCCLGRRMGLLRPKNGVVPKFLLYSYLGPEFQRTIYERTYHGSTVDRIPLKEMPEFPILLPPLPEQKAIASVLSSLDDKIDLLHRQNKTLEAMAETLFRQWFVEEAEDDWEEGVLNDILSVKGGTTPSTKNSEYWDGEICWTAPRDLSGNQHIYMFDTGRKITEQGLAKISSGLLPVGTILLSSRAPIGYLAITDIQVAINQGYIAILDNKGFSKYFLYLWVKNNLDYIISNANGSTFLEISKSVFKGLEVQKPPADLRNKFDEQAIPIFQKIKTNSIQIRTLEKLRDTLLPKLMSGEVRVEYQN